MPVPRGPLVVGALGTLLALAACGQGSRVVESGSTAGATGGSTLVKVVAAENFWGDVVRQVGGEHVSVTSIITDPEADPHTYETDAKTAAAVGAAGFVVLNGAGYDDFAQKLLDAAPKNGRTVISVDQVVGATGSDVNPHLWYSPDYVTKAAHAIGDGLAKADPADAAAFQANVTTFLASYQSYPDVLATIKQKHDGAPIAYTERVPGYLVQAAGLRLATPASFAQSIEDGDDPSAGDTTAIDDAMKDKTVQVLLYNSQVTNPTTQKVQDLAKSSGVPVVGVSETIPEGEKDFQTWQTDQAKAVLAALGG